PLNPPVPSLSSTASVVALTFASIVPVSSSSPSSTVSSIITAPSASSLPPPPPSFFSSLQPIPGLPPALQAYVPKAGLSLQAPYIPYSTSSSSSTTSSSSSSLNSLPPPLGYVPNTNPIIPPSSVLPLESSLLCLPPPSQFFGPSYRTQLQEDEAMAEKLDRELNRTLSPVPEKETEGDEAFARRLDEEEKSIEKPRTPSPTRPTSPFQANPAEEGITQEELDAQGALLLQIRQNSLATPRAASPVEEKERPTSPFQANPAVILPEGVSQEEFDAQEALLLQFHQNSLAAPRAASPVEEKPKSPAAPSLAFPGSVPASPPSPPRAEQHLPPTPPKATGGVWNWLFGSKK
ncbi:MAG: hypothetical protein WCP39_02340, partial [Chlamydiota bacterium]